MTNSPGTVLLQTPLYERHLRQKARMASFGGWNLPLHYPTGVMREHIATRMQAGLFDIGHMGRFFLSGAGVAPWLSRRLTNDPRALAAGRAHYTFLAKESGGAIDDAFLYRLEADRFLLVVNASNRERAWQALAAGAPDDTVRMEDATDTTSMLALQGPHSTDLLQQVTSGTLQPGRHRIERIVFRGCELWIASTGYTGERVGYELIVPAEAVGALWDTLSASGAVPAGLGARDSLRLEAGLPLYGHELGIDRTGREIPVFANRVAKYGVRLPGRGDYAGMRVLEGQRAEYEAIVSGKLRAEPTHLPQLIQPIAGPPGGRPLRAGYELYLDDAMVGYVTSGTSAPLLPARPQGGAALTRPIGLALLRADLRYDTCGGLALEVRDGRGAAMAATLVASNLLQQA